MRKVWKTIRSHAPGTYVEWHDDLGKRRSKYFQPKFKAFIKPFMARKFAELNSDLRQPGSTIGIMWTDFTKQYLLEKDVRGLAENSIYQIENTIAQFKEICQPFSTDMINQNMIHTFITERRKKVKPHTLNKDIRNLKALFAYGIKKHYLKELDIHEVKAADKVIRILAGTEIKRLIEACGDDRQWRMRVLMAICTGLRRSDLDNLRLRDIDIEHKTVTTTNIKTGKVTNYQPLPDAIMPEIEKFIMDDVEEGQVRFFKHKWSKKWDTILKHAGLEDVTPHDLRRTFGSMQADAGVPIKALQEMYNHSSIETTMKHYIKTDESEKRKGVNTLNVQDWI